MVRVLRALLEDDAGRDRLVVVVDRHDDLVAKGRRHAERSEILERVAALSQRERQVLEGLVAGRANKVIAYDLGISPRTVEVYRANLMTKMRASSLSELVRMSLLADIGLPEEGQ